MDFTQPIRIQVDTQSKSYQTGRWLAYPTLFTLLAGDGVRYLVGWWGFAFIAATAFVGSVILISASPDKSVLRRFPLSLAIVLAVMAVSIWWSHYPLISAAAFGAQFATTVIAVFFAIQFDWRQLLNIFANTIRFVLLLSLIIELVGSIIGPIKPPFANFEGDTPPAPAYWWVQGNLFSSDRIQGFVGNANLLAFVSLLGLAIFFVEYLVSARNQKLAIFSMLAAAIFIALSKSASINVALVIATIAAAIAMLAEGRPRPLRHRIYKTSIWLTLFGAFLVFVYWVELTDILGKSPDASGRFYIWQNVWALISERVVLGWGWISHWIPGVAPYEGLIVINEVPHYHAHNAFLDVWLQLGVVGLAVFVWLLASTFIRVWKIAVSHTNPLYLWPLFVFMVIATQALTESRLLVENGWVLLVLLALKSREPFENLEPLGLTPKAKKLLRLTLGLFGKRGEAGV
jgi:exopolysaccharide production protein ExoQ